MNNPKSLSSRGYSLLAFGNVHFLDAVILRPSQVAGCCYALLSML